MELATQESLTSLEIGRLMQRLRAAPFKANEEEAIGVVSLICEAPADFINFLYSPEEYSRSALNYMQHVLNEFRGPEVGAAYGRER